MERKGGRSDGLWRLQDTFKQDGSSKNKMPDARAFENELIREEMTTELMLLKFSQERFQ
jgi:hypothetical protein